MSDPLGPLLTLPGSDGKPFYATPEGIALLRQKQALNSDGSINVDRANYQAPESFPAIHPEPKPQGEVAHLRTPDGKPFFATLQGVQQLNALGAINPDGSINPAKAQGQPQPSPDVQAMVAALRRTDK